MKQTKKLIAALMVLFACSANKLSAQESDFNFKKSYIFSTDSILGFDEQLASSAAMANAAYGEEYKYFMYLQKRKFIIQKYHIKI